MGGWLWAFGVPLVALGPFLAVPRTGRPAPAPLSPRQRRRLRGMLVTCVAVLVLILAPWWARVALVLTAVVVIGLLVAWGAARTPSLVAWRKVDVRRPAGPQRRQGGRSSTSSQPRPAG